MNLSKENRTLLNSAYTFENYIIADSNKFLNEVILSVINFSGETHKPLFIYGSTGVGKTHLMQAITHRITKNNPALEIFYTTCEQFINHMVRSFQNSSEQDFVDFYQNLDILLIDDIHFMKGKESTQEEFFVVLNNLYAAKKQIIISGDRPPEQIFNVGKEFSDIFQEGLVAEVKSPDYKDRLKFLSRKSEEIGLKTSDCILEGIACSVRSGFRGLEGTLNKTKFYSSLKETTNYK